jgi:hypothetical protein
MLGAGVKAPALTAPGGRGSSVPKARKWNRFDHPDARVFLTLFS